MTKTRDLANLVRGFNRTNTNITRTVQSKLQDTVSVLDFIPETEHSAIKNGTSIYNATNNIQAAIDFISDRGGGTITFPGGIYRISNSLTISSSNIHLDLGIATILASGFTGWDQTPGTNFSGNRNRGLIRFVGTSVLKTECSDESLLKTSLSLNLNSTVGVRAGDLLYLESNETWYGTADKIEIHRIIKVDASTVYLASPLYHPYNVSGNTVSVEIIRPVENCSISGGIIEGEGRVAPLLNGFGPCGVEAKGVSNFKIYDSVIKYFQNKALALNWAIQSSANNLMIIGHKDEYNLDPIETGPATPDEQRGYSSFYAIFTGQCYGINLTGIRGNRVRHLTDGSNTHKSVISDCHCTYTWTSTYRAHAGCTDFTYKGCTSAAQHYGMQWGGFDLTVSNCHFVATDGAGGRYGITDDNSDATSPQKTIRLFNNIIEAGTRAIYLRSNVKGIIQGNKFINNGNQTGGLIQLGGEVMDGLAFKDNIFEDPIGTRSVQIIDGGSNGDTLEFIGNTFSYKDNGEDPPSMNSPITIQRTTGTGRDQLNLIVVDNVCPPGVTDVVAYNYRTGGLLQLSNNYSGDTVVQPTLFVDNENDAVGINTNTPSAALEVSSDAAAGTVAIMRATVNASSSIRFITPEESNVYVGSNDGSFRVRVESDTQLLVNKRGETLLGYTTDNGDYRLQVNGQIFATSGTIATSDVKYKENIASLDDCVDIVKALRPVSFTWKPQADITYTDADGNVTIARRAHEFPGGTQVGFIAQEVQEALAGKPWLDSVIRRSVMPDAVDAEGNVLANSEEFYGIAEGNLIAILTSALQKALEEIEAIKAKLP